MTQMSEKRQLMRDVQNVAFLVKEAQLFLDTHPDDAKALNYFGYYNNLLANLTAEYESKFGPITVYGVNAEDGWSWIEQPWPWEKEAE